jgi:adenosylcobinamide kinase / adenosylcobinamide-phosphate guanylyltransferase
MTIRLLGTGAADGWPNPFCACRNCTGEREVGRTRGQTAALIDDALLIDCGPETPQAAERHGVSLAQLRAVLITHQHSDHFGPSFLMHRAWVTAAPLLVVAPPDVIEACRPWLRIGAPVEFLPVSPGDAVRIEAAEAAYDVKVLAARHATLLGEAGHESVLFDIMTPNDGRILYATDTGPLPAASAAAVAGASFATVLLEETFGDHHSHGTDHLDLTTFPQEVRRLREIGAITTNTDLIAVHLSHHNPPTAELSRRLADWGARVVDDGTVVGHARNVGRGSPRTRSLIIGGARSGKSREAERALAAEPAVTYVATGYPVGEDAEWAERVRRHQGDRPAHWRTVESLALSELLAEPGEPLLIDCLTLWLTRVMDVHDGWTEDSARWVSAERAIRGEIDELAGAWRSTHRTVVGVTNEVGQGVVPESAAGRRFRDLMGVLNAAIAAESDDVRWCVAGRVSRL